MSKVNLLLYLFISYIPNFHHDSTSQGNFDQFWHEKCKTQLSSTHNLVFHSSNIQLFSQISKKFIKKYHTDMYWIQDSKSYLYPSWIINQSDKSINPNVHIYPHVQSTKSYQSAQVYLYMFWSKIRINFTWGKDDATANISKMQTQSECWQLNSKTWKMRWIQYQYDLNW